MLMQRFATAGGNVRWLLLATALPFPVVLGGCITPANTRLPNLAVSTPPGERRSLEHYDPFADQALGPSTGTRPQSFTRGREPQRNSDEGRLLNGAPVGAATPAGYATGAYRESNELVR